VTEAAGPREQGFESIQLRVEAAVDRLREGEVAAIVDSGRRRGQGSLVMVAEHADTRAVANLMEAGGGLLVLCLPPERFDGLGLQILQDVGRRGEGAQGFGTPIQAREHASAGSSAAARAATIAAAISPDAAGEDFVTPGSVFPARAGERGVLSTRRRIEAAVDLARLAGSPTGAAVLCELLDPAQEVLRDRQLEASAAERGLPLVSVEDVLKYRRLKEPIIDPPVVVKLPTTRGAFELAAYYDSAAEITHVAVWSEQTGRPARAASQLRWHVHHACPAGDALGSCPAGCETKVDRALDDLASGDLDLVVYLGSRDRWQHLLQAGSEGGGGGEDLDRYGIVDRILADFVDDKTSKKGN
jgi:3,4-dihydroxy 2-butanone 4-phosphate synthase/GTP cyclohydrolase II